jgi:hypothetical protein
VTGRETHHDPGGFFFRCDSVASRPGTARDDDFDNINTRHRSHAISFGFQQGLCRTRDAQRLAIVRKLPVLIFPPAQLPGICFQRAKNTISVLQTTIQRMDAVGSFTINED